jgi:membrane protein required for colicin V production
MTKNEMYIAGLSIAVMLIDLLLILFVIIGFRIGKKKGLILGLFSWVVFLLGLAMAVKLSVIVADHLHNSTRNGSKWVPLLCFVLLLLLLVFIVEAGCDFLHKHLHFVVLSWLDRVLGVFFYIAVYGLIFSLLLFYCERMQLVGRASIKASMFYKYIAPVGPYVMDTMGGLFPVFKDMFTELKYFYDRWARGPMV